MKCAKLVLFHWGLAMIAFIKHSTRRKAYQYATRNGTKLFLRIGDLISKSAAIGSGHEPCLTQVIEDFASNGAADFFIDIGANIGLSSCQNGNSFKKVICFEPNVLCANILKTNLAIALNNQYEVMEFGLGVEEGEFDLYMPKHNWGGAFVRSESNDYSEDTLCRKDGFLSFSKENYIVTKVKLKKALDVFEDLFESFKSHGFSKGVCKIDVEGCENSVLLALAEKVPASFELNIIFENHSEDLDLKKIKDAFRGRLCSSKVIMKVRHANKYFNKKQLNFCAKILGKKLDVFDFDINEGKAPKGDIVLEIAKC